MTATTERVEFTGSQGDRLAARLELPIGTPRAYALFAHCFTCGKDAVAASRIARALTTEGIAVLRFDFTGLGQSGGDFANSTFSSNIDDLLSAADFLRDEYRAPSILIGHSLGGAAVLAAASRIAEVSAVVTIGAPADPQHVVHLLGDDVTAIERDGEAEVDLGGRPFRIRRQFLHDLEMQPQLDRIAALDAALLVMHSPSDATVGIDNARVIFEAARHPKSFVALDAADHLLTDRADAEYAAGIIGAWVGRYAGLPVPDEATRDAAPALPDGHVRVAEVAPDSFAQMVTAGRHVLAADEPHPIGTDSGPNPYELLLAGLGSCTSMTIRMYANRKGWPLEHVSVDLGHSRTHANDCERCDESTQALEHIDRTITLVGELTDEQRAAILAIADKCPVHRTLHAGVVVSTRLG
ncbi:alpha/beta fold hydrolase [Microcella daejeonensis]|uniref:Alpha/beta fold hydrolase n=1 Tax=Microcella daejeonensis TaxID=2994971 RepID=A0A9E8MMQ8_9MICO|nr:alpha/beta fold hydrolase [Microcella daejeonensis]WAB82515.1 alpha/beta fold hydrolase [Microcella daejeonensis]